MGPDEVQQVSLFPPSSEPAKCSCDVPRWVNYVTVKADHPSLSFVSTISNGVTQPVGDVFVPYTISR